MVVSSNTKSSKAEDEVTYKPNFEKDRKRTRAIIEAVKARSSNRRKNK